MGVYVYSVRALKWYPLTTLAAPAILIHCNKPPLCEQPPVIYNNTVNTLVLWNIGYTLKSAPPVTSPVQNSDVSHIFQPRLRVFRMSLCVTFNSMIITVLIYSIIRLSATNDAAFPDEMIKDLLFKDFAAFLRDLASSDLYPRTANLFIPWIQEPMHYSIIHDRLRHCHATFAVCRVFWLVTD